ncbi:MAG TPA: CBS domain-containing protein [Stellaceae bacterium]|nr:CBS domain-containing protein [Stellaceae bacterium]
MMIASQIMSREPVTVTPDTTIAKAARLMLEHRISGLPVTDSKGRLVGMITEGDLLHRTETGTERHRSRWLERLLEPGRLAGDYIDAHARKVKDAMTAELVTVSPREPLKGVVDLMEKHRVKRLPVISRGRLVGIVSRADLVRALVGGLAQEALSADATQSDAKIRNAILAILDKESWSQRFSVDVDVESGTVHLHGIVTDDGVRTAMTVAAGNVPGVKAVHNHVVQIDPISDFAATTDFG